MSTQKICWLNIPGVKQEQLCLHVGPNQPKPNQPTQWPSHLLNPDFAAFSGAALREEDFELVFGDLYEDVFAGEAGRVGVGRLRVAWKYHFYPQH